MERDFSGRPFNAAMILSASDCPLGYICTLSSVDRSVEMDSQMSPSRLARASSEASFLFIVLRVFRGAAPEDGFDVRRSRAKSACPNPWGGWDRR